MKAILMLASLGLATVAAPNVASAQSRHNWQPINARQANLNHRITVGIRNGSLTRGEATRLRSDFQALNRLERRYRAGGLSNWERRDLNQRFDRLSARVRYDRHDRRDRRY